MSDIQSIEKFIGYVDIVGFKSLVRAAEEGRGLSLVELSAAVKMLGADDDRKHLEKRNTARRSVRSPRVSAATWISSLLRRRTA